MRLIVLFIMFAFSGIAQRNNELDKLYSFAVGEYLRIMEKKDGAIDTLFIGQYEDLKNIKTGSHIGNSGIVLLTSEKAGEKILDHRKNLMFANIVGPEQVKDKTQFLFITFFVERSGEKTAWWPQHNCTFNVERDASKKTFRASDPKFDYPYPSQGLKANRLKK